MRLLPGRHRRDQTTALREQVRLLLESQRQLYAQARELRAENAAQRAIIADLGRRLHQAQQTGPLGDTIPLPRVRSHAAGGS